MAADGDRRTGETTVQQPLGPDPARILGGFLALFEPPRTRPLGQRPSPRDRRSSSGSLLLERHLLHDDADALTRATVDRQQALRETIQQRGVLPPAELAAALERQRKIGKSLRAKRETARQEARQQAEHAASWGAAKVRLARLALVLLAGSVLAPLLTSALGPSLFVVASDSMEPEILTGSLVLIEAGDVEVGDVVVYRSPLGNNQVHRIVDTEVHDGVVHHRTAGDANPTSDSFLVPEDQIRGGVAQVIPYVGYLWLIPTAVQTGLLAAFVLAYLSISLWDARKPMRAKLQQVQEARASEGSTRRGSPKGTSFPYLVVLLACLLLTPTAGAGLALRGPSSTSTLDVADPAPLQMVAGDTGNTTLDATGAEATATVSPPSQGTTYTYDHVLATQAPDSPCGWTIEIEVDTTTGLSSLNAATVSLRPGPVSPVLADTLPQARHGTSAVWTGTHVYVFGGHDGTTAVDTIVRYDPGSGSTTTLSTPLPTAREGTAAVWTGTYAYIFGGANTSGAPLDTILRFDPATEAVTTMGAVLPEPVSDLAAAGDGTDVHLFGGYKADGHGNDKVLTYTPATDTISDTGEKMEKTGGNSAVWTGTYVYVFTGDDAGAHKGKVHRFDPSTAKLSTMGAAIPGKRAHMGAVWHDGMAYLAGGVDEGGALHDDILTYDPDTDAFATLPGAMPSARRDVSAVLAGSEAYIIGGRTGSGGSLDEILRLTFDQEVLSTDRPTLPLATTRTASVWTGSEAYIFGGGKPDGKGRDTIFRFDPSTGEVTDTGHLLPQKADRSAAIWTGSVAYIFPGDDDGNHKEKVIRYDPATGSVTEPGPLLPQARAWASAAWTGTHAYLFGGRANGGGQLDTILRFDPATGSVTTMTATLPTARQGTSAIWDGSAAYVFGGLGPLGIPTDEILRYDPATDTVTTVATLPTATGATAAVWDGSIAHVLGGTTALGATDAIVTFDPATETASSAAATLPTARTGLSGIWDGDHAYAFGGEDSTGVLDEVVRFDTDGQTATATYLRVTGAQINLAASETLEHVVEVDKAASGTATVTAELVATCTSYGIHTRQPVTYTIT